MMSGRAINYEQASTYYEHSADYYTGHQSHYDKWHGRLAKRLKLTGELSKGEFETFCQNIAEEERRKRIGFDATFSAPKSVSLALAESDERRNLSVFIRLPWSGCWQKSKRTICGHGATAKSCRRGIWLAASSCISSTATTNWICTATASF